MLTALYDIETILPALLRDRTGWNSLYVDYHAPIVERLWREWKGYRIYLHRIHPCESGEALFHPHPWPSVMRVLSGTYEMALGYGSGDQPPPIVATLILGAGSAYEMTEPDGWHYVRPIDEPTMSLMVTGKPWSRSSPKSDKALRSLRETQQNELFEFFESKYK